MAEAQSVFRRTLVRFGLSFADPADENLFADRFLRDSITVSQVFLLIGALFYYIFFVWDRIIDPTHGDTTQFIRGLVVAPVMVACAAALYTQIGRRHVEALILLSFGVGQIALVGVYTVLDHGFDYAAVGFVLLFLGTTSGFPIRSKFLVVASVFMLVSGVVGHIHADNARPGWLLINVLAILCAISFGSISAYFRERGARIQFMTDKALDESRARIDQLLHSILPHEVVNRIQAGETAIADSLGEVSIVFADLSGFTELARRLSPTDLIRILSILFSTFDRQAERFGVERIKTIGDAYMAIGGLGKSESGRDHAIDTADFLLAARTEVNRIITESGYPINVRIGFNVGPVIAGVIGRRRPAFDCWGEAVNLASRLETNAPYGQILVSESAYWRLKDRFSMQEVDEIELKGIGRTRAFLLNGRIKTEARTRLVDGPLG
jgi:adenylate cyclase